MQGGTFHSVAHRVLRRHAAVARPARGVLGARHRRRRRRHRPRPPRAGPGRHQGPALPPQGHAARPLLPGGQHAAAAVDRRRRAGAVVPRPRRGHRRPVPGVRGPQARARPPRLRRPAPLLAGPRPRRAGRGRRWRPSSTTSASTSTRTSTPCRSTSSGRCGSGDDRLTVVGDDSQAVYGFRGASPRHLLDIGEAFPGIATIVLEQSYRSSQPILDVANALGDDAPEGFQARLRAVDPPGEPARAGAAAPTTTRRSRRSANGSSPTGRPASR